MYITNFRLPGFILAEISEYLHNVQNNVLKKYLYF